MEVRAVSLPFNILLNCTQLLYNLFSKSTAYREYMKKCTIYPN